MFLSRLAHTRSAIDEYEVLPGIDLEKYDSFLVDYIPCQMFKYEDYKF